MIFASCSQGCRDDHHGCRHDGRQQPTILVTTNHDAADDDDAFHSFGLLLLSKHFVRNSGSLSLTFYGRLE
jgi:hypothetical protein